MEKYLELISDYQLDLSNEKQVHLIEKKQLLHELQKLENLLVTPQNAITVSSKDPSELIPKNCHKDHLNITSNDSKAFNNEELKIVLQIKLYCTEKRENLLQKSPKFQESSPQESAKLFHQLGIVYRNKSPDMMSLIKSAALMNAAIVRQPNNSKEIKADLTELCKHILTVSNASNKHANLIEKANEVKEKINQMRSKTTKQLKEIYNYSLRAMDNQYKSMLENDKIYVLEKLQNQITCDYTKIMEDVAKYCKNIMGKAPCKFAIAGMGSLSRKKITPYSDFEHLILLEKSLTNNNDLNYFKWFTVIFHVIIINLQETILPSVAISSLNDTTQPDGDWFYDSITVRGISFDGMMPHASKIPLGRQQHTPSKQWKIELIKSVKDMLKYLGDEKV